MDTHLEIPRLPGLRRLALATRGNTHLKSEDVLFALERGIDFWNWCGYEDGMSQALRDLGKDRGQVAVMTQIEALTWNQAEQKFEEALAILGTDYLDIVTFYYLETREEWEEIRGPGGALGYLREQESRCRLRRIGITSHQRRLAASIAESGEVDLLMIRYNAAHRGAEQDIFPTTDRRGVPVVAYTGVRWGALLEPIPGHPEEGPPPTAPECYRFALSNPSVGAVLMAPDNRAELVENLTLLDRWEPLTPEEDERMRMWGDRVRATAGSFP
jgi:predicted aldo/keto reductase-like oxidoreductase